jgi:hypothetical protein
MDNFERELFMEAILELEFKGGWWTEKNKKFNKVPAEVLKELYSKLDRDFNSITHPSKEV